MYRLFKIIVAASFTIFIIMKLYCCKGLKAPAPKGIHGVYSLASNIPVYRANALTKDSILKILSEEGLKIKGGRLNDYDATWDSLRYLIDDVPCEDRRIEAYIEFKDKSANTTFQILWFNAEPTSDDKAYEKRTRKYYECFESLLNKNKLIK